MKGLTDTPIDMISCVLCELPVKTQLIFHWLLNFFKIKHLLPNLNELNLV